MKPESTLMVKVRGVSRQGEKVRRGDPSSLDSHSFAVFEIAPKLRGFVVGWPAAVELNN